MLENLSRGMRTKYRCGGTLSTQMNAPRSDVPERIPGLIDPQLTKAICGGERHDDARILSDAELNCGPARVRAKEQADDE